MLFKKIKLIIITITMSDTYPNLTNGIMTHLMLDNCPIVDEQETPMGYDAN